MSRTVGELAQALERLASLETFHGVQADVSESGLRMLQEEFSRGRDPYGSRWDALKNDSGNRDGGPLVKTGRMRDSARSEPIANGVRFSVNTPYAAYHQFGTHQIPARRMLPLASEGLPVAWTRMVQRAYRNAVKAIG